MIWFSELTRLLQLFYFLPLATISRINILNVLVLGLKLNCMNYKTGRLVVLLLSVPSDTLMRREALFQGQDICWPNVFYFGVTGHLLNINWSQTNWQQVRDAASEDRRAEWIKFIFDDNMCMDFTPLDCFINEPWLVTVQAQWWIYNITCSPWHDFKPKCSLSCFMLF